jgi:hypothetical protein
MHRSEYGLPPSPSGSPWYPRAMRIRRGRWLVALVAVGAMVVGGLLPADAGEAPDADAEVQVVSLGVEFFRDIVHDPVTGRVVVSGSNKVAVVEATGPIVETIVVPGAEALALDGDMLWVMQPGQGALSRIDLDDLSVDATFDIDAGFATSIAVVGGRVLFTNNVGSNQFSIFELHPATGEVTQLGGQVVLGRMVSIPDSDTQVLMYNALWTPMEVLRYDISGATAVIEASTPDDVGGHARDLVATHHDTFVAASESPEAFREFSISTMAPTGIDYGPAPQASGISYADVAGGVFAGITSRSQQILLYQAGGVAAVHTVDVDETATILERSVVLASDASAVHVVVAPAQSFELALHTYPLELDLAGPPSAPSAPMVQAGLGSLAVTWDVPDDGGRPITSYEARTADGTATCGTDGDSGCLLEGLTNGVAHRVAVRAYNAVGPGEWSPWSVPVTPTGCGAGVGPFPDVGDTHPFCGEIEWLGATGLTTGYPDGTFQPGRSVTRQAVAAMLARAGGPSVLDPPLVPTFSDVGAGHPFFAEIEWLAASGLTNGYPDGTFRPTVEMTRQAVAAMVARAGGPSVLDPPVVPTFSDVGVGHPFFAEIEWLAASGLTNGFPDGTFRPTVEVTRQAVAAFLFRMRSVAD